MARPRPRGSDALSAALLLALACAGCSSDGGGNGGGPAPGRSSFERAFGPGPVELVLRLDRTEIGLAERIVLEQELKVEEGFEADFPEYLPEDFEGFAVVDITELAAPVLSEQAGPGVTVRRKLFSLEPERSGRLAIAPLAVYFQRAGETKESHFLTEEVPVAVAAIEGTEELALRPPLGILEAPPSEGGAGSLLWGGAGALGLAFAGAALWLLRRRPRRLPPPVPPHEIAWEALRRLVALDLTGKGEIELFFVHLSNILRQYIENRFQVRAPERTTEEFLEEAARAPALAGHRGRLGEFLGLSDQVKFARFRPEVPVIQSSFDLVKKFIQETTPDAA
jgi:hypothetical protein